MKNVLILIAVLFTFQSFGQGNGWEWQNPLPQGNRLNDVQFVNDHTGFAIGEVGTILKTTNGSDWAIKNSGTTNWLHGLHFVDSLRGWASGYNGTMLKTIDGGESWEKQTTGTNRDLWGLQFVNDHTGWAMLFDDSLLQTVNGGSTWTPIKPEGINGHLSGIFFADPLIGWALTTDSGGIFKTVNGGANWVKQYDCGLYSPYTSLYFLNSSIGWAGSSNGKILKTVDGGSTWIQYTAGTDPIQSIFFITEQTGYAVGSFATFRTSNGGETWHTSNSSYALNGVHFTDINTGWAVGDGGIMLKTINGGVNWIQLGSAKSRWLLSVRFIGDQNGWAVGESGYILKTSNGGATWTPQTSGTTRALYSVCFVNDQVGWAVGGGLPGSSSTGTIIKTVNAGNLWNVQPVGAQPIFYSVYFQDIQNGWIVGEGGKILQTKNGGTTWTNVNSGTTSSLFSVQFVSSMTGYICGFQTLLKTVDGGLTWNHLPVNNFDFYSSKAFFSDTENGWVTNPSNILHTSDGGNSWTIQDLGGIDKVYFIDSLTGWAASGFSSNGGASILKTIDGGSNWTEYESVTSNGFGDIFFSGPDHGWVVGSHSTILHTSTGGLTPTHKTLVSSPTFSLYPNPTQHLCHLQTTSPVQEATVVDCLGRTHLSIQNPGNTLDLKDLSSGLYWVKVKTAEGVKTQRVVKE